MENEFYIENNKKKKKDVVPRRKYGELLVEIGLIVPEDLTTALESQKDSGKRLGQILIDKGLATEEEVAFTLAMQLKIPYVDLSDYNIQSEIIESIPESVSRRMVCIPIALTNNILEVAMADPLDLNMVKDLQFLTGYNIQPAISTPTQIMDFLIRHYHPERTIGDVAEELASEDIMEFLPEQEAEEEEEEMSSEAIEHSPFVKMVDLIIRNAIKRGASDVHIEPQEHQVRVRNRIDGVLQSSIKLPKWTHPIIISRIKVLGSMDIAERRLPQDGRIRVKARSIAVDLRVSTLPTYFGEKAVIRILNKADAFLDIGELGFRSTNVQHIKNFVTQPQGTVLITGPTGTGKTSTLYACMRRISTEDINIVTVEDPVEYELEGVNQVQINERVGLTFPYILRSILRQDPNVIMIGEIRDAETAEIALQASLTGHLVLSTLHTNDAPSAITRLIDIGMPPYMIASSINCIIAQRLVRMIHEECKEEYEPDPELLSKMGLDSESIKFKFYRGAGCADCANTGYRGRTAIEEVMIVDRQIRDLILSGGSTDELKESAVSSGMHTMGSSGLRKVEQGITTIDEVLKAVQQEGLKVLCPTCGESVSQEFSTCPICKTPLVPTCSACGKTVKAEWQTCPHCGNAIISDS